MEWNQLVWIVPPAIGGLIIGHAVGMRHARKVTKRSVEKLNQQSLELLDARSALIEYQKQPDKNSRREKLLTLALTKLQQANSDIRSLRQQQNAMSKKHFVELSRMRLRAEEACETARKACGIAVNATLRLEQMSRGPQISLATESKTHSAEESAAISLADKARLYGDADSVSAVIPSNISNHSELLSGKEASAG